MKKFLSLVLALVMTMSLVTVSAGAEDFTDDSSITYEEAVDVMSAVGVIDGYTDGSFQPTTNLTRGAAAKIICNLILGPTTAAALGADTAPYSDVPVSNVFAGYIAYCQKEGIISGYADGTFRPAAPLTGYAFMKMLLGALGYDSAKENYTGANWSVNVAKQALAIGLDDGNDEFVGQSSVNREEAMLYAFNTMKATMVEYPNDSTISVGDVTVSTSGKASKVANNNANTQNNIANDGYMQFAEVYFPKLVRTAPGTAFGAPSNKWVFDGKEIGNYAATAKLTYTEKVKAKDIYADLALSSTPTVNYYIDGVTTAPIAINKTNDTKYGNQGTLTDVYYTSSTNTVTVVEKNVYLGKIVSIDEATRTEGRKVNISAGSAAATVYGNGANSFETEEFARQDYVLFTAASEDEGATYSIQSMKAAEKVSGEFTAYSGTSSVVVGGTTYKIAAKAENSGASYVASVGTLKDTVDMYLDANGNVMDIKTSEAAAANYAYVLSSNGTGSAYSPYEAELLFLDGTTKVVKTDASASTLEYDFVTFRVNSDEKYVLSDARTPDNNDGTNANVSVTNSVSAMTIDGNTVYANDDTIFVVKTGSAPATYTVYTGYKSVPSLYKTSSGTPFSTDSDYVVKAGNVVKYAYIDATQDSAVISGGTNNVIFVLADGDADLYTNSDSSYYSLKAVVNGEIGTINIDVANTSAVNVLTAGGSAVSAIFSGRYVDKYNVSTMGSMIGSSVTGIDEITSGVVSMGWTGSSFSTTLAVASDCKVFYVNKSETILTWDVASVAYDTNDLVYYTTDNGAVNNLFIVAK